MRTSNIDLHHEQDNSYDSILKFKDAYRDGISKPEHLKNTTIKASHSFIHHY